MHTVRCDAHSFSALHFNLFTDLNKPHFTCLLLFLLCQSCRMVMPIDAENQLSMAGLAYTVTPSRKSNSGPPTPASLSLTPLKKRARKVKKNVDIGVGLDGFMNVKIKEMTVNFQGVNAVCQMSKAQWSRLDLDVRTHFLSFNLTEQMQYKKDTLIDGDDDLKDSSYDAIPTSLLRTLAIQALDAVKMSSPDLQHRFRNLLAETPHDRIAKRQRLTDDFVSWFVPRRNGQRTDARRAQDLDLNAKRIIHWCTTCSHQEYCLCWDMRAVLLPHTCADCRKIVKS